MPDYRIYLVTEDNHIASAPVGIACDNDLSAVRQSQKFLDRHDIQLWQGRRLVTLLKGKCAYRNCKLPFLLPRSPRPFLDILSGNWLQKWRRDGALASWRRMWALAVDLNRLFQIAVIFTFTFEGV